MILSSWYEIHLAAMGVATGLVLAVADRRGYQRLAAGGGLLAVVLAMELWATNGWQTHPWYFAVPVAVLLALRDLPARLPHRVKKRLVLGLHRLFLRARLLKRR